MPSGLLTTYQSRTLLVDPNIEHGARLVEQLNHAGCRTDSALSLRAAHAALGANYYHSCVIVADLEELGELEQLDQLRHAVPRVWIIVLSDRRFEQSRDLERSHGIDVLLSTPFSMHELTSQLASFALQPRPPS